MSRTLSKLLLTILAPTLSLASNNLTPTSNLVGGFEYYGCWSDRVEDRALADAHLESSGIIEEDCVSWCNSQGYTFAGLEYGKECFCGMGLKYYSKKAPDSDCNYGCPGSVTEPCGGRNRLTVFTNGKSDSIKNKGIVNGYSYIGCFTDSPSKRGLRYAKYDSTTSPRMTVELCTNLCFKSGYIYAGLEYGGECFCDSTLANSSQLVTEAAPPDTGCDIPCKGDSTEWCGGKGRMTV